MSDTISDVIAIDILLEPDSRMLANAEANNERLRQAFPDGFALDAAHRPHITLLQCFVPTRDLAALSAAVGDVFQRSRLTGIELTADRYYYAPGPGAGVAGICATPTPEIIKLQRDVIAAAAPFVLATATINAFTAEHDNPAFDKVLIDYVSGFVENQAGTNFNPHVSTGVAPVDYFDRMLAEPFAAFAFAPASAAVYQLGPYGTAARLLTRWEAAA
jgi:hypothetical protein